MDLRLVVTDADLQQYLVVLAAVEQGQRVPTVAEMRTRERPDRQLWLATLEDGAPVGSGVASKSDQVGRAFIQARVVPSHRRRGIGTQLVLKLGELASPLGFPIVRTMTDDPQSLEVALRWGFVEVDRQVEQVRPIGSTSREPFGRPPSGVDIVSVAQRPELWRPAYDAVGEQGYADMAVNGEVRFSAEQWVSSEINNPDATFIALSGAEIIGVASLFTGGDPPTQAEHGLTAVRRDWRGKGVASALKRHCLAWAAANGITEVNTWTQKNNADMRRLNEHLGFRYGQVSVSLEAPMPLRLPR